MKDNPSFEEEIVLTILWVNIATINSESELGRATKPPIRWGVEGREKNSEFFPPKLLHSSTTR